MAIALLACSRSASSHTIAGSLPPSSRVTCFKSEAASAITCLPVWVSPVNPILRTFGFLISSWPTTAPGPTTTLRTPGGKPPSFISSTSRMVDSGLVPVRAVERRALHRDLRPLLRQGVRPAAEGRMRRIDRLARLFDAGLRDLVDQLAGRRVVNLHGRARPGGRRLAVNHHRAHA